MIPAQDVKKGKSVVTFDKEGQMMRKCMAVLCLVHLMLTGLRMIISSVIGRLKTRYAEDLNHFYSGRYVSLPDRNNIRKMPWKLGNRQNLACYESLLELSYT